MKATPSCRSTFVSWRNSGGVSRIRSTRILRLYHHEVSTVMRCRGHNGKRDALFPQEVRPTVSPQLRRRAAPNTPIFVKSAIRRMPCISAGLAIGNELAEDRQCQQRYRSGVFDVTKAQLGDRCGQKREKRSPGDAKHDRGAAQHRHRGGDAPRVAGRDRLCDLAHAAAVDAHADDAAHQVDDGHERPHQAEARRAEHHRHGFRAHDADQDRQYRSSANQCGRLENLSIARLRGRAVRASAGRPSTRSSRVRDLRRAWETSRKSSRLLQESRASSRAASVGVGGDAVCQHFKT